MLRLGHRAIFGTTAAVVCGVLVTQGLAQQPSDNAEYFDKQVRPILVERCLTCHGAARSGGLDLRSAEGLRQGGDSGAVFVSERPDDSLLIEYVESEQMPPDKPLSAGEIGVLRQWIAKGAFFPPRALDPFEMSTEVRAGYDWWSLQPLSTAVPPAPDDLPERWADNPIDRYVFARLCEQGLRPSPRADRRALIRRATYDLTGLPPAWEEIAAFEQDADPDAYEHLIDRLLASPAYGEHWGRHWLDVVRFGESNGYERNQIIDNAWPYRDYIIRSLNEDKPFDQLVLEHLAGDVIAAGDRDREVGTTFLVCGPYDDVGNQDAAQAAQIRANTIDDMIRATTETFLGLTVGCARCHDHKFDPISQADYYGLYATFAGVVHGSRDVGTPEQKQQRAEALNPLLDRQGELEKELSELQRSLDERAEAQAEQLSAVWTRPAITRRGVEETFSPVRAQYIRLTVGGTDTNPDAGSGYRIDEFEVWTAEPVSRNVALASAGAEASGESRMAEDFANAYSASLAIDGMFGAPWIASGRELMIKLASPETVNRVVFSSDRTGVAGDQPVATFVGEYVLAVSLDGKSWQEVASSRTRQPVTEAHRKKRLIGMVITDQDRQRRADLTAAIREVKRAIAEIPPLPRWWMGEFRDAPGPFHTFLGGSPQRPGEAVVPHSLAALKQITDDYQLDVSAMESVRRRRLAEWLVARDNPLTPRVLANRLWSYHFGTGIVDTPSDFGFMGGRPTHPELLDWLARQLHESQWRWKPIHRMIMLSETYRQASAFDEASAAVDADCRFLWRFPPRRLTAEEIRDSMLVAAGCLNSQAGGPGFRLYHYMQDNVATYEPLDTFGPETYRRSVYHQNARATRIDLMTEYDAPDCAFATPRRASTTTPLQALTMLNHQFTIDMAHAVARRAQEESLPGELPESDTAAIEQMFKFVVGRAPNDEERLAANSLVQVYGLPALGRALLNSNEFVYVD